MKCVESFVSTSFDIHFKSLTVHSLGVAIEIRDDELARSGILCFQYQVRVRGLESTSLLGSCLQPWTNQRGGCLSWGAWCSWGEVLMCSPALLGYLGPDPETYLAPTSRLILRAAFSCCLRVEVSLSYCSVPQQTEEKRTCWARAEVMWGSDC